MLTAQLHRQNYHSPLSVAIRASEAVRQAVDETSIRIRLHIKAKMRDKKSGRFYGKHQASAPGEFPAVETGNLVSSWKITKSDLGMKAKIFTEVPYSKFLDEGTRKMAPRPMIKPTATEFMPVFAHTIAAKLALAL